MFSASVCTWSLVLLPDQDGGEHSLACFLAVHGPPGPTPCLLQWSDLRVSQCPPWHPLVFQRVTTQPGGHLSWGQLQTLPLGLSMLVAKGTISATKYVHYTCPLWVWEMTVG